MTTEYDALRPGARDHRGHGLHRHRRRLGHVPRRRARRPHRHQHGSAAPVHARRAAAGAGARGRDGHAGPLGDRLPAHRHREELRVPHLDPGRHVRDAHGLPGAALQRGRLLPRRREAARRRGAAPGAGRPRAADGDQPHRLAPGGAGHRRHGAGRAHRHDRRVPRARGGAPPAGVPDRAAHEPRVHPPRRPRPGPPGGLGREGRRRSSRSCASGSRTTTSCSPGSRSGASAWRASATCRSTAASRSARPARSCGRPGCRGTCARSSRTAGYEEYDFEVPTATEADCYARYRLRVAEIHESLKIIEQAAAKMEPGPVMVEDRKIAWPAQLSIGCRRHGQLARARPQDHGSVDGVADPPLQAGHRGLLTSRPGRSTCRSSRRAASWATTWCPTAARGRCASTCATQAS